MRAISILTISTLCTLFSCARITSPTGGPKDNTPPSLVYSVPNDGQTEYNEKTITLQFDEAVTTKALESKLIITPMIQGSFKVKVRKNIVQLLFDSAWQKNTTYTLNFGNTIEDLNESNIPKNLYLSFATGETIDSLSITGRVKDLFTSEPIKEALVSIYPINDTLNITNGPAAYFTKTDSAGNYSFRNLPAGKFNIYAALDKNNNFKADSEKEFYGFLPDTINTASNPTEINIVLQRLNIAPLSIKSARHFAQYYEVTFNKTITEYDVKSVNNDSILHQLKTPDKIRFYNVAKSFGDSTQIILYANDSINSNLTDTLQLYFRTSDLAAEKISSTLEPISGSVLDTIQLSIEFNKPINQFIPDSVLVQKDTLNKLSLPSNAKWNNSRTKITWSLLTSDYIQKDEKLNIRFKKGSFISVENDTASQEQKIFQRTRGEDSGLITGRISTNASNYIVQLISSQGKVLNQIRNSSTYTFSGLDAGNYQIRLIIDKNNNGQFDIGNILTKSAPEEIIYYIDSINNSKTISVKRNWEVTEIDINHNVNN